MFRWIGGVGCVLFVFGSNALALPVSQVPNPRDRGSWVADVAGIIDAATEARLDALLDATEAETGMEIVVVTVDSVETPTPKDFATELFNDWHIGKADQDNGLLLLMVVSQRRLEMETGYGLESTLTDGWLRSMQQRTMVPAFRAGNYGRGLERGVAECIRQTAGPSGEFSPSVEIMLREIQAGEAVADEDLPQLPSTLFGPPPVRVSPAMSRPSPPPSSQPWGLFLGALGLLGFAVGFGTWRYRVDRTCPSCKIRMALLPEDEDDVHWDEGQRAEERLGSVDYQFHYCTQCDFNKIIVDKKWFSGFGTCGSCGYRASRTTTRTIQSATYDSSGLEEVHTNCQHCGAASSHTRTIPQRQRPSTSSSGGGGGGGGSFGGGSSGGGGAGSSW